MVAYELYWHGEQEEHFIGTLPERRKDPNRITDESVVNWGKMVLGDCEIADNIYFVQVEV